MGDFTDLIDGGATFDPNNAASFSTDASSLPAVSSPADNPSNGLDVTSLFNNLVGTAGNAFVAQQNSQAAQSIAAAQIAAAEAAPSNGLAFLTPGYFSTPNGRMILYLGVGILALALILRR